jgi:hypothetical protein
MSKAYCKKCCTNWAELREVWPDDNFDFHEVCPKCVSNLDLEPAKEGEALTPYKPFEPYANILKDVKLPPVPQNSKEAIEAYKQMENKKNTINY